MTSRRLRIWIDLANTPHVLFFEPVIRELEQLGHTVAVTSRRFANTQALIDARGMCAKQIGAGHDASRSELFKQARHVARVARLMAFARGQRFDVAASHLSFTQASAARRLGIPTFGTVDYEHRSLRAFRHARCFMAPSILPAATLERCGIPAGCIRPYAGLKEHVYLAGFRPRADPRRQLGIGPSQLLVTFRPVAEHARYNDGDRHSLQERLLRRVAAEPDVRVLVLPRTVRQRAALARLARELPALQLCSEAVDGPSLIWSSDLVVCGGGTMLREAAVLGVPAVSIFTGPLGAVDQWLASQRRVTLLRRDDDVRRIPLERRPAAAHGPQTDPGTLTQIVHGICDTAAAR
ncbi:MAG: DUF354 domain-containing protein [bacterium]